MAKKFLTGLNLVVLDADPATGSEGELYFNSSASVAKIYQAGSWSVLGAGGGGGAITVSTTEPASPETGDAWYKNDTGEFYVYDGTYWVEVNGVIEGLSQEQVQDYVAPLFTASTNSNVISTYDDVNNVINLNTSGSLVSIDSITYPDYIVFDTSPETSSASTGTIFWDSGDSVLKTILNENVELGIGQESVALVKNATGSTISKGKVVYISGAQGQRPTVQLASSSSEATSSKTFGFVAEELLDEAEGFVVTDGILRGLNTVGLTEGGALWLSSSGNYTQTMPTQPNHGVFLGYVVRAHASSGEIYVKIQNGYELEELHNVLISASIQNGESLVWNSASGLWMNQLVSGGGATTTVSETAPESAELGDTWYKQSDGSFFIYDGTYWVEVNGIIDGLTEDQVQDYASTLFTHNNHTGITATYDDANGEIILTSTNQDLSLYLTQASASTNYLTQASASTNYLTQESASTNYLTQESASTNYLTQASASTNYLTQASASTNYLTQASGSATYLTISNPVISGVTSINAIKESITLAATSASGTVIYDVLSNNGITYYTSNASANWTLNIRGDSGTTLNSIMNTGQSLTIAFAVTNGSTAYYQTSLQIDGSSVTPKWQGGSSPTSGNTNSIDVYSITIIKTGNATFTVWESQTKFT